MGRKFDSRLLRAVLTIVTVITASGMATITPPVCGTVFIAAAMVNAPWLSVAGHSMSLGLGLYLVPLAFVAKPALLTPGEYSAQSTLAFAAVAAGLWCMSTAIIGRKAVWLRVILALTALALLFAPGIG